ncbi:Homeobox protein 4 like [Verticillium longisporum]|nr:Homeobox protein 4 like [Verticillium longisporum]
MEELPSSIDSWQVEGLDDNFLDLAFGADWNPGLGNAHVEYSQNAARDKSQYTRGINGTSQHLIEKQHQTASIVQPAVRFSPASIKILKTWLSTHSDNPYPRVEEVEAFQRQTNLSKQQIMTWFANARRRSKNINIRKPAARDRSSSPIPFTPSPGRSTHGAVIGDQMDPFQRWTNSPPDQEPAEISAIARAVASSLGVHDQEDSLLTQGVSPRIATTTSLYDVLSQSSNPFQCTFCTQTFKTKHNWQRHEKSLHLSLERWEWRLGFRTLCAGDGDWGFEPCVLEMVENSIAPYIIDYERNSPCPFVALQTISDGPSTAFELLQLETEELTRFISSAISPRNPNRHVPTDLEIQNQARWILYDCDDPWNQTPADNENWLKDFKDSISMPKQ